MTFARRLATARDAKGLSSNALSKRLGISSTAVWNWDHGNTKPRPDMLQKLARELDVTVAWLTDDPPSVAAKAEAVPVSPTANAILADAKAKLAAVLGVPENQIRLELSLVA